jgi:deoxyadenosine/deoxycytidine kinase
VVRPRLVVQLESTGRQLHQRVLRRGRTCERSLTAAELAQIARLIDRQTRRPDVGPVLRIDSEDMDAVVEEVSAAFSAMA